MGAKYDTNGIDIHFLNSRNITKTVKVRSSSASRINQPADFFQTTSDLMKLRRLVGDPRPETHTPTGDVLETLLLGYRKQVSTPAGREGTKKRYFIVITDGAACKSPCRPLRAHINIKYLSPFRKPADSPEEGIVEAANFLQKNSFPTDQVPDPPCISYPRERPTDPFRPS